MRACSQVCGVVFNPIDDDYLNVCEECEYAGMERQEGAEVSEEMSEEVSSYYLGQCGLIIDYLL